jgi:deoxyribodipyrimidine photolyase-related protein
VHSRAISKEAFPTTPGPRVCDDTDPSARADGSKQGHRSILGGSWSVRATLPPFDALRDAAMPRTSPDPSRDAVSGVLVLPDQLNAAIGPLGRAASRRVLLVESREWLSRRPYHRARVALLLLNLRAFAAELSERGFEVRHEVVEGTMAEAVAEVARQWGTSSSSPLVAMRPAEREMRQEFEPLAAAGLLHWEPNDAFLTDRSLFDEAAGKSGFRMDAFYRRVRRQTGLLIESDGTPTGGRWSFDAENRKAWRGEPPAPAPPRFPMTPLREQVAAEIGSRFAAHPGSLDLESLPATAEDAAAVWSWAKRECLRHFGPYEDAMSLRSRGLFHTRLSPLMNLGRLLTRDLAVEVAAMPGLPIESREGFIRQIIGWREFVRHVHDATDGHRLLRGRRQETRRTPGDGGFAHWNRSPWLPPHPPPPGIDGGSDASGLGVRDPIPPAFWGRESGLRCLDEVVRSVWEEGWSHHITRLMVLGNLATLLDVSPRELADWFWIAYLDAWEWVVEPNTMGMASWGLAGLMTTKPYVAGAAYLDRMSDYCGGCRFDPKRTCPLTRLYWAFLARHEAPLRENPRMGVVMQSLRKRDPSLREGDRRTFVAVRELLLEGRPLPAEIVAAASAGEAGR